MGLKKRDVAMSEKTESGPPLCFCIGGHHRSGTSFIAEMLQTAGLDIGQRLMGPGASNPRGHFEDMDFHEFHVEVLRSQGLGFEGFIDEPVVKVPEQLESTARRLVERRRQAGHAWGWKEPRSTLLLDFWGKLVPELNFVLVFRRPWEVIDSLFRRGDALFHRNPNLAVAVWLNYNRAVLDFHDRHPERCVLIESHAAAVEPARLNQVLDEKFATGTRLGPVGEVYDDELFHHHETVRERWVLAHFFPETLTVLQELRDRAALVLTDHDLAPEPGDRDWALQHWLDFRRTQASEASIRREAQADQKQRATEVGRFQEHADRISADLERLRAERLELVGYIERAEGHARAPGRGPSPPRDPGPSRGRARRPGGPACPERAGS